MDSQGWVPCCDTVVKYFDAVVKVCIFDPPHLRTADRTWLPSLGHPERRLRQAAGCPCHAPHGFVGQRLTTGRDRLDTSPRLVWMGLRPSDGKESYLLRGRAMVQMLRIAR